MAKIAKEYTFEQLRKMAEKNRLTRYGANTPWWGMDETPWYSTSVMTLSVRGRDLKGSGLPCDPTGGMLFQTDDCIGFISAAANNPSFYGKHGLRAFLLAYDGCVVTEDGKSTALRSWIEYNDLIDQHDAAAGA